jgi:hypothetical protein
MSAQKGRRTNYLNVFSYIQTKFEENVIWISSENTEASAMSRELQKGICKDIPLFKHHIMKTYGGDSGKAQHNLALRIKYG